MRSFLQFLTEASAVQHFEDFPRVPAYKSREKVIDLPIAAFLKIAAAGYSPDKAAVVAALVKAGTRFELPHLSYTLLTDDGEAKCTGHEGRHRARAMQALGFTTLPVSLRGTIRWSEQSNPKSLDYIAQWPEWLYDQEGFDRVPFPVTREEAMAPYHA